MLAAQSSLHLSLLGLVPTKNSVQKLVFISESETQHCVPEPCPILSGRTASNYVLRSPTWFQGFRSVAITRWFRQCFTLGRVNAKNKYQWLVRGWKLFFVPVELAKPVGKRFKHTNTIVICPFLFWILFSLLLPFHGFSLFRNSVFLTFFLSFCPPFFPSFLPSFFSFFIYFFLFACFLRSFFYLLSVYLSLYLPIYLSMCVSISLCNYLSLFVSN